MNLERNSNMDTIAATKPSEYEALAAEVADLTARIAETTHPLVLRNLKTRRMAALAAKDRAFCAEQRPVEPRKLWWE